MTLTELEDRMPAEEFDAWRAFDLYVSPIGDERLARQSALTSAILGNVYRGKNESEKSIDDYDLYKPKIVRTRAQEEERFRAAWKASGLVVVKSGVS